MKTSLVITLLAFFTAGATQAQGLGSLDPTFGSKGITLTNVVSPASDDYARAIALQPDGKIVVAGVSYIGTNGSAVICRYDAQGKLDPSFSGDGIETTALTQAPSGINGVAVQANGGILVCGTLANNILLARYTPSGALDLAFGTNGFVLTSFSAFNVHVASAIGIQLDGKIVVAGYAMITPNQSSDFVIIRYNSNGTLDTSFGTNGVVTTNLTYNDAIHALAIQSDGKLVIAGSTMLQSPPFFRLFAVARYNTNGTPDLSFGSSGSQVITPAAGKNNIINAIALQPDGKIVLAGHSYSSGSSDAVVARLDANGALDNTFGASGLITVTGAGVNTPASVVVQASGKILVSCSNGDFSFLRLTSSGSPDNSFGLNGIMSHTVGAGAEGVRASLLQPDGKLLVAGTSTNSAFQNDLVVARYYLDCVPVGAPGAIAGHTTTCPGARTYSIAPVAGAQSYSWNLPAGWTGSSVSNSITVTIPQGATGTLQAASVNTCNTSPQAALRVNVTNCTGLAESLPGAELRLFPNPSSGHVFLEATAGEHYAYEIADVQGRIQKTGNFETQTKIDLGNFPKGYYHLKLINTGSKESWHKAILLAD